MPVCFGLGCNLFYVEVCCYVLLCSVCRCCVVICGWAVLVCCVVVFVLVCGFVHACIVLCCLVPFVSVVLCYIDMFVV